jgi:DNA helicase-2/ATP-dependent DNA helicase PcrA
MANEIVRCRKLKGNVIMNMHMLDILNQLNPAQRQAVEAISGPVLILAGPGSGKTRVISHRIAYLVRVCGINPRRIMAVTFTNKAAREMEDRLQQLLAGSVRDLTLGTFHAICVRILRRNGQAVGINPRFVIYDDGDQLNIIKRSFKDAGLDPKQYNPRAILGAISAAKSALLSPEDYKLRAQSHIEEVVASIYRRYQELLTSSQALDFDDLLMQVVILFRQHPGILLEYQKKYLHIMVDEFQDTNLVQYELVKQLAAQYRNICVVGDPDQSIYSWRSADLRNILNFEKDYPESKVVLLEQNYRSTKTILEAASSVISVNQHRKQKDLWTSNASGEPVHMVEMFSEQDEAQFVVSEIENLVSRGCGKWGDFAVMYRTNAQSRVLEEAFVRYGLPYKLVAGTRFYERREVKDLLAYFRFLQNPLDDTSLLRIINVPGRGIGSRTLEQMTQAAHSLNLSLYESMDWLLDPARHDVQTKTLPLKPQFVTTLRHFVEQVSRIKEKQASLNMAELFDFVVEAIGYKAYLENEGEGEERWENVLELRNVALGYRDLNPEDALTSFLDGVALVSDVDNLQTVPDAVTLITLHQAKGLEFPVVFIIGVEEGILPHIRSFDDQGEMEEERRLFYVGLTRAKQKVYLVRAFRRSLMGNSNVNRPSRFLDDIPEHLVAGRVPDKAADTERSAQPVTKTAPELASRLPLQSQSEQPALKAGDHVRHAAFGDGVVISAQPVKNDWQIIAVFKEAGVKKLLLSFARLEKVT